MRVRRREEARVPTISIDAARPRRVTAILGRILIAVALTSLAPPNAAWAKRPDVVQQFASAQKLFDAGDFAAALPLFRQVLETSGSPNARLYVARCLRELGRLPEAFEAMEATQRDAATRAETEPKYAKTRDAAAAERAILESRVGRVIIAVADPTPDLTVTLDDKPLAADRLGSPITVNPGTVIVVVEAPDKARIERRVNVTAGETKTVALTLAPEKAIGPDKQEPAAPPKLTGGTVRTLGYVVAGLGLVGFGLAGVSHFKLAGDKKRDWDLRDCRNRPEDLACGELADSGHAYDNLATVANIGGGAAVAIGAAMIIFGGPTEVPATSASVSVTPDGFTLGYTFAF